MNTTDLAEFDAIVLKELGFLSEALLFRIHHRDLCRTIEVLSHPFPNGKDLDESQFIELTFAGVSKFSLELIAIEELEKELTWVHCEIDKAELHKRDYGWEFSMTMGGEAVRVEISCELISYRTFLDDSEKYFGRDIMDNRPN